jgi:hypothetical protein
MTTKEDYEFAAKAAGIELEASDFINKNLVATLNLNKNNNLVAVMPRKVATKSAQAVLDLGIAKQKEIDGADGRRLRSWCGFVP